MPTTTSFDVTDPRGRLANMARELYTRGVLTALGGNLSLRLEGTETAWITPSGTFKGGLTPEDMIRMDLGARMVAGPPGFAPSVEAAVHAGVYRSRQDVGAVIHAHPPNAIVVATLGLPMLPVIDEALPFVAVPRVGYHPPGSEQLVEAVRKAVLKSDVALLAHHGVFAVGATLRAAANTLLSLESSCQVMLMMRLHAEGKLPVIG